MQSNAGQQLLNFEPINHVPVMPSHPWLSPASIPAGYSPVTCKLNPYGPFGYTKRIVDASSSPIEPMKTRHAGVARYAMENHRSSIGSEKSSRNTVAKYAYVKSKITPEETQKYLERKEAREYQRLKALADLEARELQECTFRPHILRQSKPRIPRY